MPTLHFIAGKAGAGKTTLARRIAAETPAVLICEDEWLATLGLPIENLDDYLAAARKLRILFAPHIADLLRCGTSVVMDFAGNTVRERQWVRSIFASASADHALHYIEVDDATCLERIRQRNRDEPAGLFFGAVTDAQVAEVNRYLTPPIETEGFRVTVHNGRPR